MRRARGFTLIELAIVLVIIGIIIGMVLKGQDLIQNTRMKKLVNEARKWEVGLWTCYDRTGKFPGDTDGNGIIGDETSTTDPLDTASTDPAIKCFVNLANSPTSHTIQLGSDTFYIYIGHDGNGKNIIVICESQNCNTGFSNTAVEYARAFDVAIDGTVDPRDGVVRATENTTDYVDANNVYDPTAALTLESTDADWDANDTAIVYFFDRKP